MSRLPGLIMPALLIVAVYYATFGGEYSLLELRAARAAVAEEEASLGELQARIDSLSARADSLRTDPGTLERVAREQFGMIREGETLYRFVPEAGDQGEDRGSD
ncbi:MAG: septum formation initiator family protein [Gemmatimonadales bacterium]